jgi:excisionase family DNA binding protein
MQEKKYHTIREIAAYGGINPQAVYVAIRKGRIKAEWVAGRWMITKANYNIYRETKHCRHKKQQNGEFIFDATKGRYSIPGAARMINDMMKEIVMKEQKLYHLVRTGQIKSYRHGASYILKEEDLNEWMEKERKKIAFIQGDVIEVN